MISIRTAFAVRAACLWAAALASSGCFLFHHSSHPGPAACTDCPDVAGTYVETSTPESIQCQGDTDSVGWSGGTDVVTVVQNGSQLTLTLDGDTADALPGTLLEDLSITFGPIQRNFPPDEILGDMSLQGSFVPGDSQVFSGTWAFSMDGVDGCNLSSPATWTLAGSASPDGGM